MLSTKCRATRAVFNRYESLYSLCRLLELEGCYVAKVVVRNAQQPYVNGIYTALTFANYLNLSVITVPAHRHAEPATGLKPGIMLACVPGSEAKLLDVAAWLELHG